MTTWEGARPPIPVCSHQQVDTYDSPQDQLIKQTYSVWAPISRETRKWHLGERCSDLAPLDAYRRPERLPVAYFTRRSMGWLGTIDHILHLALLKGSPRWSFRPARTTKGKNYGDDKLHVHIIMQGASNGTQHTHEPADSWPSPGSSSSGDERLPRIGYAVPSAPWRRPTWDERLGVGFTDSPQTARTLAPLRYLQSISAPPRQPLDDFAIRAFDSHGV